jgi:ankyrin repeat protein
MKGSGTTPLIIAAQEGHLEVVNALLVAGADKALTNNQRRTALDEAKIKQYGEITALLKENQ